METKLQQHKMERIKNTLGFWNMFVVDCVGRSDRLALFCKEDVELEIQNISRRHINATVISMIGRSQWKFMSFYEHPEAHKRHEAWGLLRHLAALDSEQWVYARDFNEIIDMSKKNGGNECARGQIEAFRTTLSSCALSGLGSRGPRFMWHNGKEGEFFIQERLDQVVSNMDWCELYPTVAIYTEAAISSNHAPILIKLQDFDHGGRYRKIFRYET